jgi:4-hydroxy-tetrahydrodipicolinate synthase
MTNRSGVFSTVTTKMRQDSSLDLLAPQSSFERLISNGVSGLIVLSMPGENASLTMAERETVIRASAEVVRRRVPLLSGLAEVSTQQARDSARLHRSFGAEGLMTFPTLGGYRPTRGTAPGTRPSQAAAYR